MKTEGFVTNVTPVESSDRVERDIFRMILGVLWLIQFVFVVREPLREEFLLSHNNITYRII